MPIYKFKCPQCKRVDDDVFTKTWDEEHRCKACNVAMEKVPCSFSPDVFPAEGIFLEHVSPEGKTFYSKQEMRDYARDNDLELGALG